MKTTIITILCVIVGAIAIYWFNLSLNKTLGSVQERDKQEWLKYEQRCIELNGLPSKTFTGFKCDK